MTTDDEPINPLAESSPGTHPKVLPTDVEASIADECYFSAADGLQGAGRLPETGDGWKVLEQITVCVLILRNGHKIVGVNEGPVSADNFDAAYGRKLAREKATDQIWPLLGYELRTELSRPVLTDADAAADLAGKPRPDNPGRADGGILDGSNRDTSGAIGQP